MTHGLVAHGSRTSTTVTLGKRPLGKLSGGRSRRSRLARDLVFVVLAALAALATAAPALAGTQPASATSYADNFAGPTLNPFWTWNPGGSAADSYAFTPGGLAITSSVTDYTPQVQTNPTISTVQSGD